MVEYPDFDPPLVESVPTLWLYNGTITSVDSQEVTHALGYWPVQVSKVDAWIKSNRNPGGTHGIVDSTLWEKGHKAIILKLCSKYFSEEQHLLDCCLIPDKTHFNTLICC